MFWDLFKRKSKWKEPYPEPGSSHEEIQTWLAGVRKRNEGMEHPIVRIGEDAQDERAAELLYRKVKRGLTKLSPGGQNYFWLKLLWFIIWRVPHSCRRIVEEEKAKVDLPDGYQIAHTSRPYWIRRPRGGDKFDRGEVAERLEIPL